MIRVKDTFINKNDIRVIRFDVDSMNKPYLVVEYAYDKENPVHIPISNYEEYEDLAITICRAIDGNELA